MEPFTVLTAVAAPYDRLNVDTDQILPARFLLKRRTDPEYPTYLFRDLRFNSDGSENPDFVLMWGWGAMNMVSSSMRLAGSLLATAGR